jgi:hypothetical protein
MLSRFPVRQSAIALALGGLLPAMIAIAPPHDALSSPAIAAPVMSEASMALVPSGFAKVSERSVTVDRARATLIRHERANGANAGLGGEHTSFVLAPDGRLKGFTRMDASLAGAPLPSRDSARAAALEFMRSHAPDLVATHEVHWVERHDEKVRTAAGEATVSGMKVKMRNTADRLWMWVIVGPGRQIVTFERDIVWITMPGRRGTEKWLHDAWVVERGNTARGS